MAKKITIIHCYKRCLCWYQNILLANNIIINTTEHHHYTLLSSSMKDWISWALLKGGVLNGGADSDAHESESPERLTCDRTTHSTRESCVSYIVLMASISNDTNGGNGGPQEEDLNHQIVVIDNGAYTVKGGLPGTTIQRQTWIALRNRSVASMYLLAKRPKSSRCRRHVAINQRSFERGYLNDWEMKLKSDHLFSETFR